MIEFLRIRIGDGAGVSCTRCAATVEGAHDRYDSVCVLSRLDEAIAGMSKSTGPNIVYEGGEPFLHPELPALIAGAMNAGVARLAVRTDAAGLAIGGNAEGALASGLRQIHVPLLGADATGHDARAGRAGAFEATSRGIRAWRDASARLGVEALTIGVVPVCAHTLSSAPGIVAWLASEGAACIRLELGPDQSTERSTPLLRAAMETGLINGVWVWVESASGDLEEAFGLHARGPIRFVGDVVS